MRYIACQNEDCMNYNAPYHLEDDEDKEIACPLCGVVMPEVLDPTQERENGDTG